MTDDVNEKLRSLPSIDRLVAEASELVVTYGRPRVVETLRTLIAEARRGVIAGGPTPGDGWIEAATRRLSDTDKPALTPLLNLTGVVVHTNLGRAVMAEEAARAAYNAARNNINLEYRVGEGKRGDRDELVADLLTELTGAESATVVNNNAAALLLVLNTLADGQPVAVSRGELIEIGGSFRLPEIMGITGATLMEIGTTNRTHVADYERAIADGARLILRVHTSNYRLVGFTSTPSTRELAAVARRTGVPLVVDLGAGALIDTSPLGLPDEPTIRQTLADGADVVTVSGDKLLGGPQAGIVVGDKGLVDRMKKNHLKRALRCDKMTIAALEATLRLYRDPAEALAAIPTLARLARPVAEIQRVAEEVAAGMRRHFGDMAEVSVIDDVARAGSGSLPEVDIPSVSVAIRHKEKSPDELAVWFRRRPTPVIGRIENDLFRLDMRCLESAKSLLDILGVAS